MARQTGWIVVMALLAAVSLSFGAGYPTALQPYLEPNITIDIATLNISSGAAYLVSLQGQEVMVLREGDSDVLDTPAAIEALLGEDVIRSSQFDNRREWLNVQLDDLQSRRAKPESQCLLYTGMDVHPCADRQTCVVSAFANPQASVMVNAAGFWEAMRDWKNQQGDLNQSVQALKTKMGVARTASADAAALSQAMGDVSAKFDALRANPLELNRTDPGCAGAGAASCFEYCAKTNWSANDSGWDALRQAWLQTAGRLDERDAQAGRAGRIASLTVQWKNFTRYKGAWWSDTLREMQSRQQALNRRLNDSNGSRWNDTALRNDVGEWEAQLEQARMLAGDGQFWQALRMGDQLRNSSEALGRRVEANNRKMENVDNSMKSIQLSLDALGRYNDAGNRAALGQSYQALKSGIRYPIPAPQLAGLEQQAGALEQLALAQVARKSLGAPPASGNISQQAAKIVNANANNNTADNDSGAAARAPAAPSPLPCPLPAALVVGALVAGIGLARAEGGVKNGGHRE